MKRTMSLFFVVLVLLLTIMPVWAETEVPEEPVEFTLDITVDSEGGRYQVGFVNVEFKKDFLNEEYLPTTFDASIYAENGKVYIEFLPDSELFFKKVHLRIDRYNGYIYDRATGENIYVEVKKQQILAEHFSRYCFVD
ncbi:MAG: hypothetical protein JEZ08_08485 [Clostridiales bacterium]|nr:hypothetical protein [Clostridiales bacterium]